MDAEGVDTHKEALGEPAPPQTDIVSSSDRLFQGMAHASPLGLFATDTEGLCTYVNPAWERLAGMSQAEALGTGWLGAIHPEDRDAAVARWWEAVRTEAPLDTSYRYLSTDGNVLWVRVRVNNLREQGGELAGHIGVVEDATEVTLRERESRRSESALRNREAQLRMLADNLSEGFVFQVITGSNGSRHFTHLSAGVTRMTGLDVSCLLRDSAPFYACIYEPDREGQNNAESVARARMQPYESEVRYRAMDGTLRWWCLRATPRPMSAESVIWDGIVLDITRWKAVEAERERLMREAIERADRDPLTDLYNHRTFHHFLQIEGARSSAQSTPFSVAVMDMNNFKFFNETYGHLVGDDVLCLIADRLREVCRPGDVLARLGGDEYAVLLREASRTDVTEWRAALERAMDAVGYLPSGGSTAVPLSLSVGAATFPDDGTSPSEVLYLADKRAMLNKGGKADLSLERLRFNLREEVEGFAMLEALVVAVDTKDRYTRRHSEDVMVYALWIAEELGLSAADISTLRVSALIHDVGKIGVPARVLLRPGPLPPDEAEAMRQHPVLGGLLVSMVPELRHTFDAVRHHHEAWDGRGYPDGLQGEEIPLSARILAVADAYSAMTTSRPYRKALPSSAAQDILAKGAGEQWDADCTRAFLSAVGRQPISVQ